MSRERVPGCPPPRLRGALPCLRGVAVMLALVLGCATLLAACGQKGPLYLPDRNPAVVTRSAPARASQPSASGGSSQSSSSSQSTAPAPPAAQPPPQ